MAAKVNGMAQQVGDSASLELLASAGLIAWGVVHPLIGWLALQIAHGVSAFRKEIDTSSMFPLTRKGVARLGQVGYITKGTALGVVGGLLSYAALTFERRNAQGLDAALQTILAQPFGRLALTTVALGFVAFVLFVILQSRYRRV